MTPHFQQRLGLFDATMLVAGTMIGSGIFIVSRDIAADVGSSGWLLLVWALTGVMTIIGALSYAELAAMMPQAGGQYVYLREAYGRLWGFLYGWTFFVVIQTGTIAAVGVAFAKFLGVLVPSLGTGPEAILLELKNLNIRLALPVPWMDEPLTFFERKNFTIHAGQIVAVAMVVMLTMLNCRGVQAGKLVQNIFTVAKTVALAVLILLGLTVAVNSGAIEQNMADPWGGITHTKQYESIVKFAPIESLAIFLVVCGAMVGSLFSADAWNNVTFTAGEIRNPRRNLPWSLFLGTGGVILLYLLANLAYVVDLPVRGNVATAKHWELEAARLEGLAKTEPEKAASYRDQEEEARKEAAFHRGIDNAKDDRVGTAVLERIAPRYGVPLMAIAIMISTFGCLNGLILMGARLHYAMAQDKLFFAPVGQLNKRGVPELALRIQEIWTCVLIFTGSYNELLDYVIFAVLAFYALTVAGLFVLRRTRPDAERPYKAFGYPIVPAMYVILCIAIAGGLLVAKPVYSWPSFLLVLTGIPVYFLWNRNNHRSPV